MQRPLVFNLVLGLGLCLGLGIALGLEQRGPLAGSPVAAAASDIGEPAQRVAAGPRPAPAQSQPYAPQDAGPELEAFREQLYTHFEDLLDLYPYIAAHSDPGLEQQLIDARNAVDMLTADQLQAFKDAYSEHPAWWDFPQYLLSLFDPGVPMPLYYAERRGTPELAGSSPLAPPQAPVAPDAVPTARTTQAAPLPIIEPFPSPRATVPSSGAPTRPGCLDFGSNATCDECPPNIPTGTIRDIYIVKGLELFADQFDGAIDADIDFCVFPGVAFSIPNPIKAITLGVKYGLAATVLGLEIQYGLNDSCEESFHRALTDFYLDATISSRLKQITLDEHARLALRIAIEEDLLRERDDHISLFQLPMIQQPGDTAVCGSMDPEGFSYCGQLEFARQIVDETIAKNSAAAMVFDVNNALASLQAGDMHYMNGEWKFAYERYSNAYRFAVTPLGGR